MSIPQLPIPSHFDAGQVNQVWRIPYQERQHEAQAWAQEHAILPAFEDSFRTCLLLVDVQNTFCIPDFELFVGGRSGNGAVEDNIRLCQFIYPLAIWPYHAMLGGIGHAVVSAVDEACFFHAIARRMQIHYEIKGRNPLTENYSVLRPEVVNDPDGKPIDQENMTFLEMLLGYDRVIIAGQAKSHCVAWTVSDLLTEIQRMDTELAKKIYLVDDLTSPVVVPGIVDYTEPADAAFAKASDAGMHVVRSTEPIF